MIRVGFLVDTLDTGGTELNAIKIAEALDRSRFDLRLAHFQPEGPLLARYHASGIPTDRIAYARPGQKEYLSRGLAFARWCKRAAVDIVHTHDIYSNVFGVPWARVAAVPAVVASRRWYQNAYTARLRIANVFAAKLAHRVVVNAPSLSTAVTTEAGLPPDRVVYLPNAIEPGMFRAASTHDWLSFRDTHAIPLDHLVVGIVASLRPVKNHSTLLEAFTVLLRKEPSVTLAIIGTGPLGPFLQDQAASLGIAEHVVFVGELPQYPNPHLYCDISVLSSESEGAPNSLLEAMAAGKPVVATCVGGVQDIVEAGKTALLVPPKDALALADALGRLVASADLRLGFGNAGRRRARDFAQSHVAAKYEEFYSTLLASHRPQRRSASARP